VLKGVRVLREVVKRVKEIRMVEGGEEVVKLKKVCQAEGSKPERDGH